MKNSHPGALSTVGTQFPMSLDTAPKKRGEGRESVVVTMRGRGREQGEGESGGEIGMKQERGSE